MMSQSKGFRLIVVALLGFAFFAAQAATITVTSVADSVTPNDGAVTLREAITAVMAGNDLGDPNITAQGPFTGANAFGTADTINFNIAGAGVHTLAPASTYPNITKPVTIDGYSQPGAVANTLAVGDNAVLLIEINGTVVPTFNGLFQFMGSGGSTVRGLVLNRMSGPTFNIGFSVNSNNNTIAGNFVNTNPAGNTLLIGTSPANPIEIRGTGNLIGGTAPASRNVIVGGGCCNAGTILILGGGGNTIQGNYIGVNAAGTAALQPATGTDAIELLATPGNIIGGTAAGAGNVILGTNIGIRVGAGPSNNTVIQGNFIGTNATGTAGLGGGTGISTDNGASNNTIGGSGAGAGNLISGGANGISLADGASNYTIQGNKIGTDITGALAIPNGNNGIIATTPALGTIIGGTAAGAGNIVAFSGGHGVNIASKSYPILGNSIFSNAGLGITLQSTVPLVNDLCDADTGANNFQNYPVLGAVSSNGGNVLISGSLNSTANTMFRLEFFANQVCDVSGNGEGKTFLGFANVTTDGACNVSFSNLSFPAIGGSVITSTATVSPSAGVFTDTSEFSACLATAVPPPTIAKAFGAPTIPLNGSTTLSFVITNQAPSNGALTGIAFTDTLAAGLAVATPNGLAGSCGSGTITSTAGSGTVSLTGGTLAAGGSCTFSVNVTGTTAGLKNNSVSVTSTEGGAGNTANASVTVVTPPTIAKAFGAASVPLNGSTTLTFNLSNPNAGASLTGVGFSDTLPAGLVVSTPNGLAGSCGGGTITATAGTGTMSLSGATLPAAGGCSFSINVTGTTAGAKVNTTGAVTSVEGGIGGTGSASIAVVTPPTISKAFGGSTIALNGNTSLTFTLTNPAANSVALTGVGFSDTLPAGLVVTTPNGLTGTCGGGTITAVAGSSTVSLSGATLATSSSCTFSVNVTGSTVGAKNNTTAAVTSTNGGTGNTASASVTVASSLTIVKSFGTPSIPLNGSTSLTFTITNPNAGLALTGVAFTDTLPSGLVVATPNGVTGSCGSGTITATAGAGAVSLSGAALAGNGSCTFSISVTGTSAGIKNNNVTVTSTQTGTGNTSNASLTVVVPPTITKSFGTGTMLPNGSTTLTFSLANPNSTTTLTGVAMTDVLPAGLVVSTPNGLTGACGGGTISAVAGSSSISLTGATLAANTSCSFAINVTATTLGTLVNTTGAVTSSEGGSGSAAVASLVVAAAGVAATNIPALQGWMLVVLGLLLAAAALPLASRRKRGIR